MLKSIILLLIVITVHSQVVSKIGNTHNDKLYYNLWHKKKIKDIGVSRLENSVIKSKVEMLGEVLRRQVDKLKESNQVELVFLVDASASVGEENFASELRFVQKLLADFTVSENATRIAVITFASKVITHTDHISSPSRNKHKCSLLYNELPNIHYVNSGGGTYTIGALQCAQDVLTKARPRAKRAVFLITDGFSNGGDPLPVARQLKQSGVMIFTFGIQSGNIQELYEMASEPGEEYSYILDGFAEFLALVRRALHQDLKVGSYRSVDEERSCDRLCANRSNCCDDIARCSCGVDTGHYACICPAGYYGSGLVGSCMPCPNGTYSDGKVPGDKSLCVSCPDANHITLYPAAAQNQCSCKKGFVPRGDSCRVVTCPKLSPPQNGYFVKRSCGNVLNAACGIRCRVGYKLVGSSIRLCREDGTWSGEEPTCLVKTCPPPSYPENGNVTCSNTDYTVDTECEFSCKDGHLLVGSKTRNCLPLARWDGLQATCKPLLCPPLPVLSSGIVEPQECTSSKVIYGTWCNIKCKNGYKLEGPSVRICGIEKSGKWSGGNGNNKCIDDTPPLLTCPNDIIVPNDPGEDFTIIDWLVPYATDSSGNEPAIWSVPPVKPPLKLKIGVLTITYVALDNSLNEATCNFTISVQDKEPPEIENCESPAPFLTDTSPINITLDHLVFHDNSQQNVTVSVYPDMQMFYYGNTEVTYLVSDMSGNNNTCSFNVTVQENVCLPPNDPINGHLNCTTHPDKALHCILTCEEGYAFAVHPRDYFCTYDDHTGAILAPDVDIDPFPDCSVTVLPNTISQEGMVVLEGETTICRDPVFLGQLESVVRDQIMEKLSEVCGENEVTCQVSDMKAVCDQILSSIEEESNIVNRKRRDIAFDEFIRPRRAVTPSIYVASTTRPSVINNSVGMIELRFHVIAKTSKRHPNIRNQDLRSHMRQATDKLQQIGGRKTPLDSRLSKRKLRFRHFRVQHDPESVCEQGTVLKNNFCIKCPVGTYMNESTSSCEPCGFGYYQSLEGKTTCIPCPKGTSTKKIHSKSIHECRRLCPPGTYGRRKRQWISGPGTRPCVSCDVGTYQDTRGQIYCMKCPGNTTTERRGTKRVEDCKEQCLSNTVSISGFAPCFPCPPEYIQPLHGQTLCISKDMKHIYISECFSYPCLNGGSCRPVGRDHYVCDCREGYRGSTCEVKIQGCDSSPCYNGGSCNDTGLNYTCACPPGYTGSKCELDINECLSNPCKNGGSCTDNINSFICDCPNAFKGDACEENLDECEVLPCLNNGTCIDGISNYTCQCKDGYTGRHCEEEPPDPCENEPCFNGGTCISDGRVYSCNCQTGYEGMSCETNTDECTSNPCLNGGTCEDMLSGFTCHCNQSYMGKHCEIETMNDFFLRFPSSSMTDYVILDGPRFTLKEVTLCLWLKSDDKFNYGTVFSYAADQQDNSFTLTDYNGFVLYVNGQRAITDVTANDGVWHFVCASWTSQQGHWGIYIDGKIGDEGSGLANGTVIPANGTLVLGQEQDRIGGGFSESEAFTGHMANVAMWNMMLGNVQVWELANMCPVTSVGNIFTWSQFLSGIKGNLKVESSYFCSTCPTPASPTQGTVRVEKDFANSSHDVAVYSCNDGYIVYWKGKTWNTLNRRCLKQGEWEEEEPVCKRISCGFPGYFPRGRVFGYSYLYSDIIKYVCRPGYTLIGSWKRACMATGKWSDPAPRCQGRSCPRLPVLENGDLHLLADDREVDNISDITPEYGHQIELECLPGHKLIGPSILTCLVDGHWDKSLPKCQRTVCFDPPRVLHGSVVLERKTNMVDFYHNTNQSSALINLPVTDQPNNLQRDMAHERTRMYNIGDTVKYSCDLGYEVHSTSYELTCREGGEWRGDVPVCAPVTCPELSVLQNGFLLVDQSNGNDSKAVKNMSEIFDYYKKYEYNTRILVTCDEGYQLVGPKFRICLDKGIWSSADPLCMPVECDLNKFEKLFKSYNVTSTITVPEGMFTINGNKFGNTAEFKCHSGYRLSEYLNLSAFEEDYIQWECRADRSWRFVNISDNYSSRDLTVPLCEKKILGCHAPKVPENSYFTEDSTDSDNLYPFGNKIKLKCQVGYKISGSSEWTCLENGKWSGINVTCEPVRCRPPPLPDNTEKVLPTRWYYYGTVVAYKCKVGYRPYGDLSTRCQASGRWSRIRGKCSPISCGKPHLINGASIIGQSYLYQDKVTYKCPPGMKISGQIQLTCQANGSWSDNPKCEPI